MPDDGPSPPADGVAVDLASRVRAFAADHDWPITTLERLAGDVSTRLYLRLSDRHRTAIVAVYRPEDWSTAERFLRSGELLSSIGVRVPTVLAADSQRRLMLLEDLGSTCHELAADIDFERVFAAATELIPRIRSLDLDDEPLLLPALDAELLGEEMSAAIEAVAALATDSSRDELLGQLNQVRAPIQENVAALPLQAAHRDFMVRNLVPLPDGSLAVLDHQDLRPAPAGYDFASLTNDSRFPRSEFVDELRRRWLPELEPADYHWLAAQRTLKASGTYARALSQGNDMHRKLIVPTLDRLVDHLQVLPEVADETAALRDLWPQLGVLD